MHQLAATTAVRRLPAGIYYAPGKLHGLDALLAVAPDGELTLRTIEPGTDGSEEVHQLEGWLQDHGTKPGGGPSLSLV